MIVLNGSGVECLTSAPIFDYKTLEGIDRADADKLFTLIGNICSVVQVGLLRQQLQDNEKVQRDMVVQYETQLNIFREEIGKLKKSYEKLQRRQLKDRREHVKERSEKEGISELNRLSKKVE
eukprot:g37375.t1